MKKIAFTYGDFDCLNMAHYHLVREMRKHILPDNEVIAVLPDDYASFVNCKCFPVQSIIHRQNNLSYLIKNVIVSYAADPSIIFQTLIDDAHKDGDRLIFVGYDDNKEFPGHEILRKANVPLRFIKKPKSYEISTEKKAGANRTRQSKAFLQNLSS